VGKEKTNRRKTIEEAEAEWTIDKEKETMTMSRMMKIVMMMMMKRHSEEIVGEASLISLLDDRLMRLASANGEEKENQESEESGE